MKQFSQIQQLIQHSQSIGIEQHHRLTFKIKHIEYRLSDGKCYYIVYLHNSQYFFKTFFRELAAELLYQQENDETTQFVSIHNSVIDILKWRFIKAGKSIKIRNNQRISLEILEFSLSGEDKQSYKLQELDLNNYQQYDSQNSTLDCSLNIQDEPEKEKKIKIEYADPNNSAQYQSTINSNFKQITISELNPKSRQWTLAGRIIQISPLQIMESYYNQRKRRHFKIAILDVNEDIIFGYFIEEVCDKFWNVLQYGKIYNFSTATILELEPQNKNKNQNLKNKYKLTFFKFSKIEESPIQLPKQKQIQQHLTIRNLKQLETETTTDILAYVLDAQVDDTRINLRLTDKTDNIDLTVWKNAYDVNIKKGMVIALYNALIYQENGSSRLKLTINSIVFTEYQDSKVDELLQWGKNQSLIQNQGYYKNLFQIDQQVEQIFQNNDWDFVKVIATIKCISKAATYLSCTSQRCKYKKVDDDHICPKCLKFVEAPIPRFRIEVILSDGTSDIQVVMFDGICQILLKICADYFSTLDEEEKQDRLLEIEGREYEFGLQQWVSEIQVPQIIVKFISKPTYIIAVQQSLKELQQSIIEIE